MLASYNLNVFFEAIKEAHRFFKDLMKEYVLKLIYIYTHQFLYIYKHLLFLYVNIFLCIEFFKKIYIKVIIKKSNLKISTQNIGNNICFS